jgi:chemotaxis protein methyltransferase CheR
MAPSLSSNMFAILSALIEEKSGLHYDLASKEVLAAKAEARLAETGFDSWLDYYYFLRYDEGGAEELDRLIETLLVHETYLFRELDQLTMMVDQLVVPATATAAAEGRKVRIWSAACSTGEEPVSLALLLSERQALGGVELVASDLSAAALARARSGKLSRRSLRALPPSAASSPWLQLREDGAQVAPQLLEPIRWERLNLLDAAAIARLGKFDLILCRNVLIYFKEERTREVVQNLGSALLPSGALFVGVSESLLRFGTSLLCEERAGVFYYRRALP